MIADFVEGATLFFSALWKDYETSFRSVLSIIGRRLDALREQTTFTYRYDLIQRLGRQDRELGEIMAWTVNTSCHRDVGHETSLMGSAECFAVSLTEMAFA